MMKGAPTPYVTDLALTASHYFSASTKRLEIKRERMRERRVMGRTV
jgi:hypothetical protein